jgi:hypothetical protein
MKKTILAALLAASIAPAFAANYYVVVPVPNRTATSGNITVTLSGYSLPSGVAGRPYGGFDFNTVLQVKGDPTFFAAGVHWSAGALPAGLTLSSSGKLSGTPTVGGSSSFSVRATYKNKAGAQQYQVLIATVNVSLATSGLPQGQQGAAYSYDFKTQLSVSGDPQYSPGQVTWSSIGTLPAGLALNSDGTLTGTPTAEGTFPFTVKASYLNSAGQQDYQVFVGAITVVLGRATLPNGMQGTAYSYDLKPKLGISGDAAFTGAGVTWSVASGSLPAGLSLGADGVISGTPTDESSGTPFTVQAAYKSKSGQQNYSILVGAIAVVLNTAALPNGVQGSTYSYDLKPKLGVSGDAAYTGTGITWSVASGTLPAGLSLSVDGVISGTPTDASVGTPFTIQSAYKTKTGQQNYSIIVGAITVALGGAALPAGELGAAYSYDLKPQLNVSGDTAYTGSGVTWSVVSGALPMGLSLSANGVISGTPTAASTGTPFVVQAAYKTKSGQQGYAIVVAAITVTLNGSTAPAASYGAAYNSGNGWDLKPNVSVANDAMYAGNGVGVAWSVSSGALPTGLTLNSNGTVTGTPSAAGTNPLKLTATYKTQTASQSYTINYTVGVAQNTGYRAWSDGTYAKSCLEYFSGKTGYAYTGATGDGIYRIDVDGSGPLTSFDVWCDMTNDGGGWTTFQRRTNGAVNFYQGYAAYAAGFGSAATEYWMGNDRLAALTAAGATTLRIDLTRYTGATGYAKYAGFKVATAADAYRISLTYSGGTIGDSLTYQNGMQFSTQDVDHDLYPQNCAVTFHGAWWYNSCHQSNLNGGYLNGVHTSYADGMEWNTWTGQYESMVKTEMKVR